LTVNVEQDGECERSGRFDFAFDTNKDVSSIHGKAPRRRHSIEL